MEKNRSSPGPVRWFISDDVLGISEMPILKLLPVRLRKYQKRAMSEDNVERYISSCQRKLCFGS
jgi:hypothetical protein